MKFKTYWKQFNKAKVGYQDIDEAKEGDVKQLQRLIDNGMAWHLEGSVGRAAMECIESGRCTLGPKGFQDAYGNYVPSKYEVQEGTKGAAHGWKKKSRIEKSDFQRKWVSTDAWRGYEEVTPKKGTEWFEVHSNWVTGEWEDAGEHKGSEVKSKIDQFKSQIKSKGGEVKIMTGRTSNVFSTAYQVFVRGIDKSEAQSIADSIFR